MRVAERVTPVAAILAALSTLACCVPFGFHIRLQTARPWLLGAALVLLGVGFLQLYRGTQSM